MKYRKYVLLSVIMGTFMAAIEGTIVATAIPDIVGDLGGFKLYSWVFSAYLLTNALTILIYGKCADLFGRKPVFLFGTVVFLAGSLCAGFAPSMKWLILFRFIQGIGAGAVQPIAMTIVGDLYSVEERGSIQGYLSSVWGISALCGPALGGLFVQYLTWAWVFWINIPIGLLSIAGIVVFFKEDIVKEKHQIDFGGAGLLFVSITLLMFSLIQGGAAWPWFSWQTALVAGVFVLAMIIFIMLESRVKEPMVPLTIWKNPLISIANLVSLTSGIVIIGLSSFLPSYVQVVMGKSATIAGFTLTAMSIGWPISSTICGKLINRAGFRVFSLLGGLALTIGGATFLFLSAGKTPWYAALGSFIVGIGMGMISTTFIVAIQSSVNWKLRGAATSSNMFMRMLGSSIGAALLGGVLNTRLAQYIDQHSDQGLTINSINKLLQDRDVEAGADTLDALRHGLAAGLHSVYIAVFIFAVLSFVFILLLPKKYLVRNKAGS